MMSEWLENILRPIYQNVGIVGARGPVPSWTFLAAVVSVIVVTFALHFIVCVYDSITTGKCLLCGGRDHQNGN